jgi:hypothetical protein
MKLSKNLKQARELAAEQRYGLTWFSCMPEQREAIMARLYPDVDSLMDNCGSLDDAGNERESLRAIISVMHSKMRPSQWRAALEELTDVIAESQEAADDLSA